MEKRFTLRRVIQAAMDSVRKADDALKNGDAPLARLRLEQTMNRLRVALGAANAGISRRPGVGNVKRNGHGTNGMRPNGTHPNGDAPAPEPG